jgi:hypothetical protein
MAVIQISRIQHRRGLEQDFPQLSSAELGWSLDTRRLFIGNGTLTEGAPTEGVTEILTEYTDILTLLKTYTFKGEAGGTTVQTGPSANSPIVRTFQEKLDDVVSVRDFGAVGDGSTDDTAAIQRALVNLWPTANFADAYKQHRTLYFPAGIYIIQGDVIDIPPFVKLVGDGYYSTRIKQIDNAQPYVAQLVDGFFQSGTNFGRPNTTTGYDPASTNWHISDLVFERIHDKDIVGIDGGSNIVFERCSFIGVAGGTLVNDTPIADALSACVRINGKSYIDSVPVKNVVFNSCAFTSSGAALDIDRQAYGITIMESHLDRLYRGIVIGEESGSRDSPSTTNYPYAVSVTDNYFETIAREAIKGYADSNQVMSSGNLFENIGSGGYAFGAGQPVLSAVINFESHNNISSGDQFKRTTADRFTFSVVEDNGFNCYYIEAGIAYQLGRLVQGTGTTATLTNNTASAIPVVNQFSSNVNILTPSTISYTIERNGFNRTGTMRINYQVGGSVVYDDEYSEISDIGVALSANVFSNVSPIILYYTTTNTGISANLVYDIKYHTANNTPF